MSAIPIKLAKVKTNGRRFIVISIDKNKVRCKGEVQRVSGYSAVHGPDKTFLDNFVEVIDEEYTEALLNELHRESTTVLEKPKSLVLPPEIKPMKTAKMPKADIHARKKWLVYDKYSNRLYLTDHARKQLELEGYDVACDGLGNYLTENSLQDAAMDGAAYHCELEQDGMKPGYSITAEAAADYIYSGMLRALKEFHAAGKNTGIPGKH